jgi:sulfatase maturation enzyme AslB (radical SAM superfamily)
MIKIAQISPFDYCNNKCWYCPVKYYDQPKEYIRHTEPELLEKIIKNLVEEKGKLVSEKFDFIYTGQYNEIILYKYLKEVLEILRKYGIKTILLSNGVAFTPDKIEIIKHFKDVVIGINFNIPSFQEDWKELTQGQGTVEDLIENVRNVYAEFGQIVSMGMNDVKNNSPKVEYAKSLIPGMNIYPAIGLCDRAGLLVDKGISNVEEINRNKEGKTEVTGCRNGNRTEEWLHVNSLGKAFFCCDDYFFKYEFGDFNKQTLSEIWGSKEHEAVKKKAMTELCPKCSFAIWG